MLVKNRYEVAYRPIPITDTDKHLPYRQNRYIGKKPISAPITDTYRYRLVHYPLRLLKFPQKIADLLHGVLCFPYTIIFT